MTRDGLSVHLFLGPTVLERQNSPRPRRGPFNDENALVRIDMSEYTEKYSICGL